MEASRPHRKRPQSDIKPSPNSASAHEHHRRRSTGTTAGFAPSGRSNSSANAFADFRFFDDEPPTAGTGELYSADVQSPRLTDSNPPTDPSGRYFDAGVSDTPPPPRLAQYIDTRLRLQELTDPSGSPVLKPEFTPDVEYPIDLGDSDNSATKQFDRDRKVAERRSNVKDAKSPAGGDRNSTSSDESVGSTSVATQIPGPSHIPGPGEQSLKPKIVEINKAHAKPGPRNSAQRESSREAVGKGGRGSTAPATRKETLGEGSNGKDARVKKKSLTHAEKPALESRTTTLETTRAWLDDLADQESESWSNESVVGSEGESSTAPPPAVRRKPRSQPKAASSSQALRRKPLRDTKGSHKQSSSTKPSQNINPETPAARPASPPLHRNAADTRKPLEEKQDRSEWTLYNLSCWTDKSYLKTLLRGPTFEFRTEPHGESFLTNISREMLKHFIGKDHLTRIVRDYSVPAADKQEGDGNVLVFPESLVDSSAIMRIIRYMRRCCVRTTTVMKPHFQLHAPPSLEANIETIRACNIFGLYADSRRIQQFLVDKKIPGGKVTMEDVGTIWEGYDGALRDSMYTDALLTHIIYNVLSGSDNGNREDVMVLLKQEEFGGLRELIGTELGIKKRAREEMEMFRMRKQMERTEKENRAIGKGKPLNEMEKIRATRGPMVQGRLLRVLSYDALLEADPTAETRYKSRPSMFRKSMPNLSEVAQDDTTGSAQNLSNNAVRRIREPVMTADIHEMNRLSVVEEEDEKEVPVPPKASAKSAHHRLPAPAPPGRKEEGNRSGGSHPTDTHPPEPPKDQRPRPHDARKVSNPNTGEGSSSQAVEVREFVDRNPHLSEAATQDANEYLSSSDWREIDERRASKPYYSDEEIAWLLHAPQNTTPAYFADREARLIVPRQQHNAGLSRNTAAPLAVQQPHNHGPHGAPRAESYPALGLYSDVDSNFDSEAERKRRERSEANARSVLGVPAEYPLFRSQTDTSMYEHSSTLTKKKKANIFKQMWDNVRNVV